MYLLMQMVFHGLYIQFWLAYASSLGNLSKPYAKCSNQPIWNFQLIIIDVPTIWEPKIGSQVWSHTDPINLLAIDWYNFTLVGAACEIIFHMDWS